MIDFRPFYQQIATTNLSAWLETLPLQLKEWEKQTHGDYAKWSKIVDFLPDLQADTIDLKNTVKSDRTSPLSEGEKQRIIHHLKQGEKDLIIYLIFTWIANGVLISNGIVFCLILRH